jgi:drug/metabolite transporter (DMT)-like permease
MKSFFRVHLLLIIVNVIYGINFTVAKSVMPAFIEPLGFIVIRVGVSMLLFTAMHFLFIREKVDTKDFPLLMLCALFGVALNQSLFFIGIKYTTPIHGSLIMIATPILVLIFSRLVAREKVNKLKTIGILLGASGALVLVLFGKTIVAGVNTPLGDLFIFLNATCYAIYLVIVKKLMNKYNPFTVVKWIFIFGFIFVLPFGWNQFSQIQWHTFTTPVWIAVASVVLGATFIAYLFNNIALRHASPSVVGIYIYLQPLVAAAVAIYFGKDVLSPIKLVAALLIFVGVYLVSKPDKKTNPK